MEVPPEKLLPDSCWQIEKKDFYQKTW